MRRSAITLFMLTLSALWIVAGRCAMVPVMFILAGVHLIHSAVDYRLDKLVSDAVTASYEVRVRTHSASARDDGCSKGSCDAEGSGTDSAEEGSLCSWTGPRLVRIVGDFSTVAHMMGLTGGSEDARCPFWWPCSAKTYMSLCAQAGARVWPRTVPYVANHWELVCWFLARWCALRSKYLKLEEGAVTVRCRVCRARLVVDTSSARRVTCSSALRALTETGGAEALPTILSTPLKKMLSLLRRRGGGVRGYPVIRSIPVVLQVPVLYCTGTILKKQLFFL